MKRTSFERADAGGTNMSLIFKRNIPLILLVVLVLAFLVLVLGNVPIVAYSA